MIRQVEELQQAGRLLAITQTATAWELLAFGITSSQEENINLAGQKELRQAIAGCIDRQALAELYGSPSQVAEAFTPPMHPLYNPQAWQFAYDPQAAGALLESSGWQDLDADPLTPRTSSGVPGLPDGTPLMLNYLVSTDAGEQAIAQAIQASLAQCGIGVQVQALPLQEFLAPGPDGLVFGRQFELAQYAWMAALEPPCALYLSSEIPGDYPAAPKGWGALGI